MPKKKGFTTSAAKATKSVVATARSMGCDFVLGPLGADRVAALQSCSRLPWLEARNVLVKLRLLGPLPRPHTDASQRKLGLSRWLSRGPAMTFATAKFPTVARGRNGRAP
jgi:hypothetical protein